MALTKNINGIDFPLSDEEIIEFKRREAEFESQAMARALATFITRLSLYIDNKAAERQYFSAISCISYIESTNSQWNNEARLFNAWRDQIFLTAINYQSDAKSGLIANPSFEDFLLKAPVLTWP